MKQLLNHECTCNFQLLTHNEDQHKINKAKKEATELLGGVSEVFFFGMAVPIAPPGERTEPCRHTIQFDCSEATGIRILNALLQEKEEKRREVLQQSNDLLRQALPGLPADNPIHDLHNQE